MTGKSTSWWRKGEGQAHHDLFALVEELKSHESGRRSQMNRWMALYGDRHALQGISGGRAAALVGRNKSRLTFSLCKAVCDAAQSTIAAQHTRSRVLTSEGEWSLQRKAKLMELALEAEFDRCDVHRQAHHGFLDAVKTGFTGFKVYSSAGEVVVDLVRPGELVVDPADARYGKPRRIYQICAIDKEVVKGVWGNANKPEERRRRLRFIDESPKMDVSQWFPWMDNETSLDQVMVVEAWQAPDPADWWDAKPGRHIVAVNGCTLLDEGWDRPLPFCWWRYDTDSTGFWGRGIVENLRGIQRELNHTLLKIQDILRLSAGFRILVEKGPDGRPAINIARLGNSPGDVLEYESGSPPVIQTGNQVPSEFFRHVEWLIAQGFEQEGVSMMGAVSRKPAGLDSGAAIREFNDIESKRFEVKSKSFERFIGVDLAKLIIEEKRWIALNEKDKEKPAKVRERRRGRGMSFKTLKWGEVDIKDEEYQLSFYPSSALPSSPAGRIATVEAWMAAGLIGREEALRLTNIPDLEDYTRMQTAPTDIVLDALETMIEDGEFVPPEPVQNLKLSIKLAGEAYQRFRIAGVPEENTELVLRYIDDCKHLMKLAAEAENAQAPGMAGGMPGGAPTGVPAVA